MSPNLPSILVVDDEARGAELLQRTLRGHASVETAVSGDEAWDNFERGHFDLVISDQRMPGLSGVELLGRIADHDDTVGRILITGYSDLAATVEAINVGRVHAYLHKPCSPPDLRATVFEVLDRVRHARENSSQTCDLDTAGAKVVATEPLAAIGKLIAMTVHDLRASLTTLAGISREIVDATGEELQDLKRDLDAEVGHMKHMKQLCEEMLEVTHPSDGALSRRPEPIDEVVETAISGLIETASAYGVEVEMQLAAGVELDLDEAGLRRALRYLIVDALEAMPDGGHLRVATSVDGDAVVIALTDSGRGIPEGIAEKIFEPLVTQGKRGGSGLGLAVVQKFAHDHGGALEVGKPEGGGTSFTLRFPLGNET
jgi:signal transduction histidine kinase